MNIYPQDLGIEESQSVQRSRNASAPDKRNVDFWDGSSWPAWAWWAFGGPILSLMMGLAFKSVGIGEVLILFCVCIALVLGLMRGDNFVRLKRGHIALTVRDVVGMKEGVTDPLQRPFLALVIAAINTPPPPDVESQKSVREAIHALGASIAGLPLLDKDGIQDDPAAFQLQATQLGAEAAAEHDPVIAASLRRRADALHRQTETAERTNTLLRRNEALRQEIAGQIAALQTSLTALRVGGAQAVYELADVAANIQQVAIEAGAITQARSEMGDIISVARREPPQAVQQVRH